MVSAGGGATGAGLVGLAFRSKLVFLGLVSAGARTERASAAGWGRLSTTCTGGDVGEVNGGARLDGRRQARSA